MKAKRYTTAMLIALIFATASIQAQSARRPVTQEKKERARTTSTYKRETTSHKAKSTQPARTAQTQQVRKQSANYKQPAKTNNGQKVRTQQAKYNKPAPNNNGRQYVRNENANNNNGNQVRNQNGYKEPRQKVRKPAPNNNGRQYVRNENANNNNGNQVRNQNGYKESRQQLNKPVSMTTTNNPRSTYRKPNNKITVEARYNAPVKTKNYYNNRAYYGGNHYHYAYPTTKVRFHYHHNTYYNNYRVLYYPTYGDFYWNRNMYRDYHRWYPGFNWSYNYGHRIQTISVFDVKYNLGEVAYVYGRVYATWHNNETDDFLLFFGGDFPYQQFTVVVPGHVARKFSWRPERFFLGEHVTINGLITTFDGSPEIVVKDKRQLSLY
jgi:hypothetical protein